VSDTSSITDLAVSANVSAGFSLTCNTALNVKKLGHKPTDPETAKAQSPDEQTGKIRKLKTLTFKNISEFAEFLEAGNTLYTGTLKEDIDTTAIKNVLYSWVIGFDFDFPSVEMEDVLSWEFVQKYGAIIQPSYSASGEKIYKFHLFFVTDRAVTPTEYKALWALLSNKFNVPLDKSKKGANNLFFGSINAPIIINEANRLPVDEMLAEAEAEKKAKEAKNNTSAQKGKQKHSISNGKQKSKPNKVMSIDAYEELDDDQPEESVTEKLSRHVRLEIVDKILGGDIRLLFPWYPHNFKLVENITDPTILQKAKGCNPWKPSTTGDGNSFYITLLDNDLAPVFCDGSGEKTRNGEQKNGGSIFEYWYKFRPDAPWVGKSLKEAFKDVADNICIHFGAPKFDFRTLSKAKQRIEYFRKLWGESARYNEMTLEPELDGQPVDFDCLCTLIADKYGLSLPKEEATEVILYLAKQNSYSPVRDYLESVELNADIQPINLDKLASRYFGAESELFNKMMKKTLVAAVARVFDPGCQVDTVCVLQGSQGLKKSTFWKTLAGNWFDDGVSGLSDKDDASKLRRYWILEFPEIENIFQKKEISGMRIFITRKSDNFRPAYARRIQEFPRTSVLVGSVNPKQFLRDPEGNRRYWVIPVNQKIDLLTLQKERDGIFKAAVLEYRKHLEFIANNSNPDHSPHRWWFNDDEELQNKENNEDYSTVDALEEIMIPRIAYLPYVQTTQLLEMLNVDKTDKQLQMRVSEIFKKHGWEYKQRRLGGLKARYWFNPNVSPDLKTLEQLDLTIKNVFNSHIPGESINRGHFNSSYDTTDTSDPTAEF